MSLSYQRLRPVVVKDPITIVKNHRDYAVLKSGSQATWKSYTTTSISNSSLQFSCPPPSGQVFVDRKMALYVPFKLTFSGTAGSSGVLLNAKQDAPRAFGLSSSIDTFQATINNQSVSINMADIIQALLRHNTNHTVKESDYSMTPSCLDQSQQYSDLYLSNRSSLGDYASCTDEGVQGNGAFPFNITSNTSTSATVEMGLTEPIFLSPFYFGHKNGSGFYNITSFDFNITFINNLGYRLWSHDAISSGASTISSITVSIGGTTTLANNVPLMLFKYITPQETDIIPYNMPITYPYFDILRFPTQITGTFAAGSSTQVVSNNIQLNSVPRRIYLYVRRSNTDLYNSPNYTDTYFGITNVSIQYNNFAGLLSSASQYDLYKMAVKNHSNLSWTQWSGGPVQNANFSGTYGTVGSILPIEFATDIGLDSITAPGKLQQGMLQVTMQVTNLASSSITNPVFYIIVVNEGSFTIEGLSKCSTNIGVLSSRDILDAQMSPWVNYNDVQEVNGGDFWSGLKQFGSDLWSGLKTGVKEVAELAEPVANIVAKAGPLLKAVGLGEEDMEGGVVIGGKRHKKKHRMSHRVV